RPLKGLPECDSQNRAWFGTACNVTFELWMAPLRQPKNYSIHAVTSGYEIRKSLPAPVFGCSAWFGCIVSGFLAPETFIRFD
ncbi:MAG: hypothetical protein RL077_3646, partial [Verrucomicrobiota bacterium]